MEINITRNEGYSFLTLGAPCVHNVEVQLATDAAGETSIVFSQLNYKGEQEISMTRWQFGQVAAKVAETLTRDDAAPATDEEVKAFFDNVDKILSE